MQDQDKTKDELIDELNEMRRKVAELETAQATAMDAENPTINADQSGYS
jgi:phage shock protein A